MENNVPKDVFSINEGKDGKSKWVRIGQAFTNRDGSTNVFLDALPREGKIQIRERKKKNNNNNDSNGKD